MHSPRTQKYIEALNREGDNFDYWRWLQWVREEEAQAKGISVAPASGEIMVSEPFNPTNTPDRRITFVNSTQRLTAKRPPIGAPALSDYKSKPEPKQSRLRRRLGRVSDMWDEFQANRARDAVYPFLSAIFSIVIHYKVRRKTTKLLRHAFEFAGLPYDGNAEPFAAVIRCTCEQEIDNKTISKWARALRYVAYCKVPNKRLKTFMSGAGGINTCADRYARYYGRGGR
jgi:hypothetical protein